MPDRRYRLSEAADADLESLYERGIDRFGVNSADRYYDGLIARLGEIADTPQLWPEADHSDHPSLDILTSYKNIPIRIF